MGTGEYTAGKDPCDRQGFHLGGVEIVLPASCYGNRNKLRPNGPLGSSADSLHQAMLRLTCVTSKLRRSLANAYDSDEKRVKVSLATSATCVLVYLAVKNIVVEGYYLA